MKDHEYEVVLNYVRKATDALVAVMDELEEYGDKNDKRFLSEALDLTRQVNRLHTKISYHRRVVAFAQADALRTP